MGLERSHIYCFWEDLADNFKEYDVSVVLDENKKLFFVLSLLCESNEQIISFEIQKRSRQLINGYTG